MKKSYDKRQLLTQAVLASTLFVSPLSFATVVSVPTANPIQTSIGGDVLIQVGGSVGGVINKDGVIIDTVGGKLDIDPNNTSLLGGIQTSGAAALVAAVRIEDPSATVTVGSNSTIQNTNTFAGSDAILIENASGATIINSGVIENVGAASDSAIEFFGASTNGTITNKTGGIISTGATVVGSTIIQSAGSTGISITNAGTISQAAAKDAILLNGTFNAFENQSGGLITQTAGGAGTAVVRISGGGTKNLINETGATISATTAGTAAIIVDTNPFGGSILNAGTISSIDAPAIFINKDITGAINNSGLITTNTPTTATIFAGGANLIVGGGIINSGQIQSHGANPAIDLKTNAAFAAFTQDASSVLGNVLLGALDGSGGNNVFNMNGGTITGNVLASSISNNILTLKGGTIAGNMTLGALGDTVDLSGTIVTGAIIGGVGNDIVNVTGGNFGFLEGTAGDDTLNIKASFTPNGDIDNFDNINVLNADTVFTLNNPITNMNGVGLIISPDTQMVLNANISGTGDVVNNGLLTVTGTPTIDLNNVGTVTNNGITSIGSSAILTVKSDLADAFLNNPDATLQIAIAGLTSPGGKLSNGLLNVFSSQVRAIDLDNGSFVRPTFTGFIPEGSQFDIVTVTGGGTIFDDNTLVQPNSAVITFSQSLNLAENILTLTSARRPYQFLSSTQVTRGIAGALDVLAEGNGPSSTELLNLLAQLDQLGTQAEVEAAMESLAPPFNYGLIAGSHIGMDSTFNSVQLRIEDLRARRRYREGFASIGSPVKLAANGLSYGDPCESGTVWGKVLGAYLNQKERGDVAGYKAKGAGVAIGTDWGFNDCTTFGIAGSYTKVNVDDKNPSPKDQAIKSWQGTAYGWWEFMDGVYLDAMLGLASNHYKTNQVINVNELHTASQASFNGTQWGAQMDLGWALGDCESYYFAPFARLKYIHLNLDQYTQNGAGDIGLTVDNNHNQEFLGGIGFRLGSTCQTEDMLIVPELSALVAYDFKNDGEQSVAGFIGGGPAFETNGIKPGRTIFDLGLGINAHFCNDSIFSLKYDLEVRSKFIENIFYVQYNYFWS